MLKETRTYKDFDGKERTEDFYFNLSKAELMELEASVDGGWLNSMKRIISAQNNPAIMREFKNMILSSYGEKSPDGKRFIKSPELSKAFSETEAYSDMFVEFSSIRIVPLSSLPAFSLRSFRLSSQTLSLLMERRFRRRADWKS